MLKLDSLLRDDTLPMITTLRDDLLGDSTKDKVSRLRDEVLGEMTREQIEALREEVLGEVTRREIRNIRNELLGEATRVQVGAMRDELIGQATTLAIQALIDGAVTSLAESYEREISPALLRDLDSLRTGLESGTEAVGGVAKSIVWSLAGAIAFLIAVAGFFVWRYFRHRRMLKLVTAEIDGITNEDAKEDLKKRIKGKAEATGLQPGLHKVIEEQRREQPKT